jgi:ribosomal protein S18 acetylase RimI-like enzyme
VYVGPYLEFEPTLSLVLEDGEGVAGYALGALDSRVFFRRYITEWLPDLQRRYPEPMGEPSEWTRVQQVHHLYHHPDLYCPEPYTEYPSHLHIDLLPRVQGLGWGRRLIEALLGRLRDAGSVGVHLGMSASNDRAYGFYRRLGFLDLAEVGEGAEASRYLGKRLAG